MRPQARCRSDPPAKASPDTSRSIKPGLCWAFPNVLAWSSAKNAIGGRINLRAARTTRLGVGDWQFHTHMKTGIKAHCGFSRGASCVVEAGGRTRYLRIVRPPPVPIKQCCSTAHWCIIQGSTVVISCKQRNWRVRCPAEVVRNCVINSAVA